jgi:tetratricopeptide (TPR) repeat protein
MVRATLLVGAAVAVMVLVYLAFLRPDEATRRRYELVMRGESAIMQGEHLRALESFVQALEIAPDDPEVNLLVGVTSEALNRAGEAELHYARAQELYGEDALFYTMRSQKRSMLGLQDRGELDAQRAIEVDESFALAYCALGTAQAGLNKRGEAIRAYQRCADLAYEQEQHELYVVASTQLGTLIQTPP